MSSFDKPSQKRIGDSVRATEKYLPPETEPSTSRVSGGNVSAVMSPMGGGSVRLFETANAPVMDGTASLGEAETLSRSDHVHPSNHSESHTLGSHSDVVITDPEAKQGIYFDGDNWVNDYVRAH